MTPAECIAWTLRWEGSGYTDHPSDRGGPTKYGITLATLKGLGSIGDVNKDAVTDRRDVQLLDHATAVRIYESTFWRGSSADVLHLRDWRLSLVHYDAAVHSGTSWARRRLQQALGVTQDGILGPKTWRALDRAQLGEGVAVLCRRLLGRRTALWTSLMQRDPRQRDFQRGWGNRMADLCLTTGLAWPDGPTPESFGVRLPAARAAA